MRFQCLDDWLNWQESLHPSAMDLGLERVRSVVANMAWPQRDFVLITVAGTNGKGSSVAYLEAIYRAAGYRTGTYTSPHLQRYNERIGLAGSEATDTQIMAAFARLDAARGDTTITYFEFGTLAAMDLFYAKQVDVAIMEVGIGGRLDAVNVFDTDCALVTTIDIDHRKWLGDDREAIGTEKAGIFRARTPAVSAERDPPRSLVKYAESVHAPLAILGWHYDALMQLDGRWTFEGQQDAIVDLPSPGLPGEWQLHNAAGVIAVTEHLRMQLPVPYRALAQGIASPQIRGRFQRVSVHPEIVIDVAHNAQATSALADNLAARGDGMTTLAIVAMLGDKDLADALNPLKGIVDAWFVGPTDGPRGLAAADLSAVLLGCGTPRERIRTCASVPLALAYAMAAAKDLGTSVSLDTAPLVPAAKPEPSVGDRAVIGVADGSVEASSTMPQNAADSGSTAVQIIVFGSFHTVGEVLDTLAQPDRLRREVDELHAQGGSISNPEQHSSVVAVDDISAARRQRNAAVVGLRGEAPNDNG